MHQAVKGALIGAGVGAGIATAQGVRRHDPSDRVVKGAAKGALEGGVVGGGIGFFLDAYRRSDKLADTAA